jgi:hypothetical protein
MAKAAGVWSAWAKYGTEFDSSVTVSVDRVTHWTAEEINRERAIEQVEPDAVLEQFDDIFKLFDIRTTKW